MLDGVTGETIGTLPGVDAAISGCSQSAPRSAAVAGGYAYFITRRDGLWRIALDMSEDVFSQVTENRPFVVNSDDRCLYYAFRGEVVRLDGASGRESARVTLPKGVLTKRIVPLDGFDDKEQVALLLDNGQGMVLVDFKTNDVLWRAGEGAWYVTHVAATPYGLVATLHGFRMPAVFLDRSTGETKTELPREEGRWGGLVSWMGDVLFISHSRGGRVFEWQEGEVEDVAPDGGRSGDSSACC
jgi:hypothetical protein